MVNKLFNALIKSSADRIKTSLINMDIRREIDNIKSHMDEVSKRLSHEIKKVNKHIHNYFDKWMVDIEYEQGVDSISSTIQDGSLSIRVVNLSNGDERNLTVTIPDDIIIESLVQKYDPTNKKAIFSFTKKDIV